MFEKIWIHAEEICFTRIRMKYKQVKGYSAFKEDQQIMAFTQKYPELPSSNFNLTFEFSQMIRPYLSDIEEFWDLGTAEDHHYYHKIQAFLKEVEELQSYNKSTSKTKIGWYK